jgi:hypothetical protein
MAMAPAAATRARAIGGSGPSHFISTSSFLGPPPNPIRLPRRAGANRAVLLGAGRRDAWGADGGSSPSSEGGRLVDEDMATLRRRIREARAESSEEDGILDADDAGIPLPPTGWTELERRHHGSYVVGVRGAVGLLEALLVNARPGLGAGLLAVLLLGVPASLFLVCAQLIRGR